MCPWPQGASGVDARGWCGTPLHILYSTVMPASRSRSPPPRRRERYPEASRSGRDRGYDNRGGRARWEDDRRDSRRRDDDRDGRDSERNRDRRERNSNRGEREERSPRGKYIEQRAGPSSRPRSPRPSSHHSRSRSRSKSVDKTQPNFNASGLLAAETNTVTRSDGTSTVLKYNEPPEARRPSQGWRLYVFKGKEQVGEHF